MPLKNSVTIIKNTNYNIISVLELNLNIIIIHHGISEVDLSLFDRIITLSNKMFSNITDSDLFKNKKI